MYQSHTKLKILIVVALLVLSIAIGLLVASSYSFIQIDNPTSNNTQYKLTDSRGNEQEFSSSEKVVRRMVKKGSYDIIATADNQSSFNLVTTEGFLRTTDIELQFEGQAAREFIGIEPRSCMHTPHTKLISFACGDQLTRMYVHEPATESTPTYTSPVPSPSNGTIEGVIEVSNKPFVLSKSFGHSHDTAPHTAIEIKANNSLGRAHPLNGLQEDSKYNTINHGDGFIMYSNSLDDINYFYSLDSNPQKIEPLIHMDNLTYEAYDIDSSGDVLAIAYSQNKLQKSHSDEDSEVIKRKTFISIDTGKEKSVTEFDIYFNDFKICGTKLICAVAGESLYIYEISSEKAKELYKVSNVSLIEKTNNDLLIKKPDYLLRLHLDSLSGHIEYAFDDYNFCGISTNKNNYVLCINTAKTGNMALLMNQEKDSYPIDKKILPLINQSEVKGISVYRNRIYISPDYGEYRMNSETGRFSYDSNKIKNTNQSIDRALNEANIDKSYSVNIPLRSVID